MQTSSSTVQLVSVPRILSLVRPFSLSLVLGGVADRRLCWRRACCALVLFLLVLVSVSVSVSVSVLALALFGLIY